MKKKSKRRIRPDREKGAPPPDYMPAIFGWMTWEEMQEQAREIVDFVDRIKPGDGSGRD